MQKLLEDVEEEEDKQKTKNTEWDYERGKEVNKLRQSVRGSVRSRSPKRSKLLTSKI